MRTAARALAWAIAAALPCLGAACDKAPVAQPEPMPTSASPAPPVIAPPAEDVAPATSEVAGAAPTSSAAALPPGTTGVSLAEKAEACWASSTCSLEEAARLFQQADDAGAIPMNCFSFYYAMGVPADPKRARACFERHVQQEKGCGHQSPMFERIYLAAML